MKTISILNLKGGVAKTFTAANMAYELYRRGYRVLLIDNDKQGNLSKAYSRYDAENVAPVTRLLAGDWQGATELIQNTDYVGQQCCIRRTRFKTLIMTAHIDKAVEEIEHRREAAGRGVEYKAFEMYFMQGMDYAEIAEELDTGKNTPRRWVTGIINELSVLLWGIDEERVK